MTQSHSNFDEACQNIFWIVHVEVRLKSNSTARIDSIRDVVREYIEPMQCIALPSTLSDWGDNLILRDNVEQIHFGDSDCPRSVILASQSQFNIHVYQTIQDRGLEELSAGGENGEEEVMAASVTDLPCALWEGLWDSLIYDDNIKSKLLNYIYSTLLLSDAGVDFNIVSWNRVVLLHGPPGTGKTSLCRALSQKLAIRLTERYAQSRILEINSHSLFSRWFSESGKLVQKLFMSVTEMVEDEDTFVVVLIDEVESLTAARASAMAGNEPSDALRVVNALLTQLDKLKHRKNVLIMATSNLPKAIDTAFLDRADIVQYIGLPPTDALYTILNGCMLELMKKGVLTTLPCRDKHEAQTLANGILSEKGYSESITTGRESDERRRANINAARLWKIVEGCEGMSGRMLRRLPVLAYARCLVGQTTKKRSPKSAKNVVSNSSSSPYSSIEHPILEPEGWLTSLEAVIASEVQNRTILG